jgi:hypothetical protein
MILLLCVLLSPAFADDSYQAALAQIHAKHEALQAEMRKRGLSTDGIVPTSNEEEKKMRALIQVYDTPANRQAQAGKLLFGRLVNRLVVSSEAAPAILILDEGQGVFSGLRILGRAHSSSTDGRVQIEWDRLVLPAGSVKPIKGTALDEDGALGVVAEVFSSKAWAVAGAMASSLVSGFAAAQETTNMTAFGVSQTAPGTRNGVLQGLSQTAADQSKQLIDQATQEKPILVVRSGTEVTLYLDEEVRF